MYRRLVGPQSRSGKVRKISPPPEFDPRTVQPAASRYTETPSRFLYHKVVIFIKILSLIIVIENFGAVCNV
jgi:hypothetical protein